MELCSDEHDEVCYESRYCPVCTLKDEKDNEIEEKNSEIKSLIDDMEELQKIADHFDDVKEYLTENYPEALI